MPGWNQKSLFLFAELCISLSLSSVFCLQIGQETLLVVATPLDGGN
jgi:hypothetical protein